MWHIVYFGCIIQYDRFNLVYYFLSSTYRTKRTVRKIFNSDCEVNINEELTIKILIHQAALIDWMDGPQEFKNIAVVLAPLPTTLEPLTNNTTNNINSSQQHSETHSPSTPSSQRFCWLFSIGVMVVHSSILSPS